MRVTLKFERVPKIVRERRRDAQRLRDSAITLRKAVLDHSGIYYGHIDTSIGDRVWGIARDMDREADKLECPEEGT